MSNSPRRKALKRRSRERKAWLRSPLDMEAAFARTFYRLMNDNCIMETFDNKDGTFTHVTRVR